MIILGGACMEKMQIIRVIVLVAVAFISTFIIDKIFKRILAKKNNLSLYFAKNVINALIILFCIVGIVDTFDSEKVISQRILMSSSVIAIVLGIVFQAGLVNLVHGIILVIFKPFNVGDRVQMDTGSGISGYVKQITLRHVVIADVIDNSDMIIPNSIVETCVIKNLTNGVEAHNKYPLTVSITYEQAEQKEIREKAKKIISDCILANSNTLNEVKPGDDDLFVRVDYKPSSVDLVCFVETLTAEKNFLACSEIKEAILDEFGKNHIEFAYEHLQITGKIATE